ncbi:MAG: PCI domain-containing protein [Planctomycetota bacterium]
MKAKLSMGGNENSNFPLTRFSLIERVKDVDGRIRKLALEEFAQSYQPALISFLVKCKDIRENEAEDIVQDFILDKIISGKVMELAGRKGRFRSLLRACLQNHLIDQVRKNKRELSQSPLLDDESDSF